MRRITTLLVAGGAVVGIGSVGAATSADAGGRCPPGVHKVVYYGPPACCSAYAYGYYPYYKTTQFWPVARKLRSYRAVSYRPIKARRR